MLETKLNSGTIFLGRCILLLFVICNTPGLAAQNSFRLTGYIIGDNQIQPNVDVSIKSRKIEVVTDFRGKFRIECTIGDTITIEKKYSRFAVEKYVVADSLPVIMELSYKMELDQKGRPRLYGSVTTSNNMPKVYITGAIHGDQFWGAGYNFYLPPLFPDNQNLPVLKRVAIGVAGYSNGQHFYFFPNVGLNIRSYYNNLFNSNFGFSFLAPSVKLGGWINTESEAGFGYELGLTLLNFSFSNRFPFRDISIDIRYNNFANNKGAFLIGLSLNKSFPVNEIPRFIKEAIR